MRCGTAQPSSSVSCHTSTVRTPTDHPRDLRPVGRGRPDLRDRLVAPARPRLRQHDPGRLGDPHRVLRRDGDRQRRRRADRRPRPRRRSGCTASSSSSWSSSSSLTPITFRLIHELYRASTRSLEGAPSSCALVRFGLALLALAPATVLMGATLPTLTRHLTRDAPPSSAAFGRLYAANTIGAIVGTLAGRLRPHRAPRPDRRAGGRRGLLGDRRARRRSSLAAHAVGRLPRPRPPPRATTRLPSRAHRHRRGRRLAAALMRRLRLGPDLARLPGDCGPACSLRGRATRRTSSPLILAIFLIGIADRGAASFNAPAAHGSATRSGSWRPPRSRSRSLAIVGLVVVIAQPRARSTPCRPLETAHALVRHRDPASSCRSRSCWASRSRPRRRCCRRRPRHAGAESGSLLAVNTVGAIVGSFVIPFVLIPLLGSPVGRRASSPLTNAASAIVARAARRGASAPACGRLDRAPAVSLAAVVIVGGHRRGRASLVQPNERLDPHRRGGNAVRLDARTRSPPSRPVSRRRPASCGSPARR